MRVLVLGAGALGSAIGGFMGRAGHEVTLVGRAAHMDAIRARGLRITGIWGDHLVNGLDARTDLLGLRVGSFDVVLIAVKSFDTRTAVEAVLPLLGPDTLVCSYQNGLGNAEIIAEHVGWERTVGARAIYGVWTPEPGHIEITVIAQPTLLGVYSPETPVARVREIAEAMDASGVPTQYTESIASAVWGKAAYNCALNALCGLLEVPYGVLLDTEHTRGIMADVVRELYTVGRAMNVPLDPPTDAEYLELLFNVLIPPTAAHFGSLREDFRRHRRTEVDALNGAVARFGQALDIYCPANALLTRLVHAREHALGIVQAGT